MRIQLIFGFLYLITFIFPQHSRAQTSPEAEAFYKKAMVEINPRHVTWIRNTAKEATGKNLSVEEVRALAHVHAGRNKLKEMDIDAFMVLVLTEAIHADKLSLKEVMTSTQNSTIRKEALRYAINELRTKKEPVSRMRLDSFYLLLARNTRTGAGTGTVSFEESQEALRKLQDERDSLQEKSEEMQLKMQMYMDRMTKADSARSNAMKKFSEVANQIIGNWK